MKKTFTNYVITNPEHTLFESTNQEGCGVITNNITWADRIFLEQEAIDQLTINKFTSFYLRNKFNTYIPVTITYEY
jgi:hypothetical protein